ncbi:MAG: glycosyltransferase family 4 protein [Armatimonadota bacterium]
MKLAIVTHNVIKGDGQGRVNYEITRRALQKGHEVTLIADRVDESLVDLGAVWKPIHPKFFGQIDLCKCFELAHRADRVLAAMPELEKADIIHAYGHTLTVPHHINTAQFVHDAWLRSPVHSSKTHRNINSLYQWLFSTINARLEKISYKRARHVVAASNTVYAELQHIGVEKYRLNIILNGVDTSEFHPATTRDRDAFGLPPDPTPLALFAGDIRSGRKNLESVLKAMVSVPSLHLGVIGSLRGSPYPVLAQSLGLTDRVHFLGYRNDIAAIMRLGDLFVFPSRYEPFGNVILEAMASGVPVITSANVGASCVVTPSCGIVIDNSDDVSGLAQAMSELVSDRSRREAMSRAARTESQNYTWDKIADQYLALYHEVASR